MSNIIKVYYISKKNTVVITKIDNLLSPKEIAEKFGDKTSYLYGRAHYRIFRSSGACIFKPISIFNRNETKLGIPYLPYELPREVFSIMIDYMKQAGKELVECIKKGKEVSIEVPISSKEKIIEI